MRVKNILILFGVTAPLWADHMVGTPARYRPLSEADLSAQNESLHSQPLTPGQVEEAAAQIHEVGHADLASSVLQRLTLLYSRPDLEAPVEIRLNPDPALRFTPREVRSINRILAGMPADFLNGITYIDSRRYVPSPASEPSAPMKLAEAAPDGLVIYARPMVPDLLPQAIVLHYKTTHNLR